MAGKPSRNAAADIRGQKPKAYQAATMGVGGGLCRSKIACVHDDPPSTGMTITLRRLPDGAEIDFERKDQLGRQGANQARQAISIDESI
ncbi:hypothetical protein HFO33_27625 [Rhizobium leguminosarum]|uniref:hypothetical protein n=1 Tax=Rhizobium leguminosarum TaxID=384 RepID=UPI001C955FFC|nr:hypothetical protein [Rhizobium leguminosarum]MBY5720317.1 hypothetical protein [Rhizobium leguminosarum]